MELPKFEMYEEGSQIRKSAKAIPSCNETIEHLEILFETKSLGDKAKFDYFMEEYDKLGRKINKFIQAVEGGVNE